MNADATGGETPPLERPYRDATSARWQVAGLRPRIQAAAWDAVTIILLAAIPAFIAIAFFRALGVDVRGAEALAFHTVLGGVTWLVGFAYLATWEGRRRGNGETWAKRDQSIRTVRLVDGQPMSWRRAALRAAVLALTLPSGLPLWALIAALSWGSIPARGLQDGWFWVLIGVNVLVVAATKRGQGLHDLIAGTAVVDTSAGVPSGVPRGIAPRTRSVRTLAIIALVLAAVTYLALEP